MDIVAKQGKHRNPVTGSGGMLLGTVEKIGDALKGKIDLKEGDKIATLVSLSLTPLRIDKIKDIRPEIDQVDIDGKAILFESGIYAKIPADLPEGVKVANKTGELSNVENDAGILYDTNSGNDLVICFLSENLTDTAAAQSTIAQLSRTIYLTYNG